MSPKRKLKAPKVDSSMQVDSSSAVIMIVGIAMVSSDDKTDRRVAVIMVETTGGLIRIARSNRPAVRLEIERVAIHRERIDLCSV
jgi:hypothetical protein